MLPRKNTRTLAKAASVTTSGPPPVPPPSEPGAAQVKGSKVRLELDAPTARSVYVAGSFNDWKPEQTALRSANSGRWSGELVLSSGRYEYLFLVDGRWQVDPNAKDSVPNPFGGKNSILVVA